MLNQTDLEKIKKAIEVGGDIWNNPLIANVKSKIKSYYRRILKEQCCYCRKNFEGEFNMVIDIEHILPKKKYEEYMFTPVNLSIACKRCNMQVKKDDISFISSEQDIKNTPFVSENYRFSHPNLDNYFDNINIIIHITNNDKIVKYDPLTEKGKFTYYYFKLDDLEIEAFNKAQGIISESLDKDIPTDIINQLDELFG